MFKPANNDYLIKEAELAERNYVIQKNDLLQLHVYTNRGEKIIDPNRELSKGDTQQDERTPAHYLVDINGMVKFPQISEIRLEGLTIRQAEQLLEKQFNTPGPYVDPFVILKFVNKRVVVLGAPGGQVIPLTNENVRLSELLALAKGLSNEAKAHNIRVLRAGQLMIADLSSFEGYKKNNMVMESGRTLR